MGNLLQKFFWYCAGAEKEILDLYPTEHVKYTCAGVAVFLTAILATFTGGYAFFTVFDVLTWTIPISLIWGLIIFNLDRYIVSSYHKKDRRIDELLPALPRLLVAIVIAIVIANPLEMRILG
jgi:hypothetical protein